MDHGDRSNAFRPQRDRYVAPHRFSDAKRDLSGTMIALWNKTCESFREVKSTWLPCDTYGEENRRTSSCYRHRQRSAAEPGFLHRIAWAAFGQAHGQFR